MRCICGDAAFSGTFRYLLTATRLTGTATVCAMGDHSNFEKTAHTLMGT